MLQHCLAYVNHPIRFPMLLQEAYNNIPVEPKVTFLLNSLHNGSLSEEVVQMAAILLRRLFTSEFSDFYPKVCWKFSLP